MSVKNKIKLILLEKDMSQNELANRLNISKSTLSNIISGKQNATLETALDISKILKEPVERIFYKEQIIDESKMEIEFQSLLVNMKELYKLYEKDILTEQSLRRTYKDMIEIFLDKYSKSFQNYIDSLPAIKNLQDVEKMIYSVIFEVCDDRLCSDAL